MHKIFSTYTYTCITTIEVIVKGQSGANNLGKPRLSADDYEGGLLIEIFPSYLQLLVKVGVVGEEVGYTVYQPRHTHHGRQTQAVREVIERY